VVTSLLKINIDKSNYSPATHIVLDMMVVVADSIDYFFHLRQLINRIVLGSQNFSPNKTENNSVKPLRKS
jgi:hypothetical protein